MKKTNIVWLIFRKVIGKKNGVINKILKLTYLQNQLLLNY
jgi:hypothetical protein